MKPTERSVAEFVEALAAPAPTPGGGSAAALGGALGASLLAMVAAMPKHRAGSEEDVGSLRAAGAHCRDISARLLGLVDEDSEAYDLVVAAYRLPKATDAEQAERRARIQTALTAAVEAPLAVMQGAADAVHAGVVIAAFGHPQTASDVGVALDLLTAALRGAKRNVEINLGSMTDEAYAASVRLQVSTSTDRCDAGLSEARARLTPFG